MTFKRWGIQVDGQQPFSNVVCFCFRFSIHFLTARVSGAIGQIIMTAPLANYYSCTLCSNFVFSVDNTGYGGEFKLVPKAANETFMLSNMSLLDIR